MYQNQDWVRQKIMPYLKVSKNIKSSKNTKCKLPKVWGWDSVWCCWDCEDLPQAWQLIYKAAARPAGGEQGENIEKEQRRKGQWELLGEGGGNTTARHQTFITKPVA